jgi:hypothetical protein
MLAQRWCSFVLQVDEINDMFAEARDYIEDAKEDAETVSVPGRLSAAMHHMYDDVMVGQADFLLRIKGPPKGLEHCCVLMMRVGSCDHGAVTMALL